MPIVQAAFDILKLVACVSDRAFLSQLIELDSIIYFFRISSNDQPLSGTDNRVLDAVAVAGTYTGERLNGLKHGKGKKMMRKFEKSEPDEYSSGEEVFPDHSKYIGEFENGFAHGQGSRVKRPVTHPSRCNWDEVSDMMFFEGEMIYADGSKYKGKWEKGNYHGKGNTSVISVLWTSFAYLINQLI